MKLERLQILSLAYTGQLGREEAEHQLAALGKKERRLFRFLFVAVFLAVAVAAILVFHLEDKIRFFLGSAMQTVEGFTLFREIWVFFRHVFDAH